MAIAQIGEDFVFDRDGRNFVTCSEFRSAASRGRHHADRLHVYYINTRSTSFTTHQPRSQGPPLPAKVPFRRVGMTMSMSIHISLQLAYLSESRMQPVLTQAETSSRTRSSSLCSLSHDLCHHDFCLHDFQLSRQIGFGVQRQQPEHRLHQPRDSGRCIGARPFPY